VNDLEKNDRKKTEEMVSNRVLSMFAAGAILLWALAYLYKMFDYVPTTQTAVTVTKIAVAVAGVGFLASLLWFVIAIKKKTFDTSKIVNPATVMGLFGVIVICCGMLLYNYILSMKLIYIFIPAVVIYYLIYNVYQRAFFGLTVTHGIIAFALYFMSNSVKSWALYVYAAVCLIVCAAAFLACMSACKNNGTLKLGKCSIRLFDKINRSVIKTAAAIYGVSALAVIAALFIPVYAIIYIFYAVIAFVVCCAVYYTIRLM